MVDISTRPSAITHCPACGSSKVVEFTAPHYGACTACLLAWEPLPPGEALKVDGEMLPFEKPCDNCAFRGKSTERADANYWEALQAQLANGGQFFCHKGVPFKIVTDAGEPNYDARGFEYPRNPDGTYDMDRMRLCRGYLNEHVGPMLKRFGHRLKP